MYSLAQRFEIYPEDSGSRLEVGPDRDAPGTLIEFRQYSENGNCTARIVIAVQEAILLRRALGKILDDES